MNEQQISEHRPAGWFDDGRASSNEVQSEQPTYIDAIRSALEDELADDERVVLIGQDIGIMGGAFRATQGLWQRFGYERVIDTPISEIAMTGACIGMAISGMRPIAEFQFADFISCAYDQLVNEAAKLYFRFKCAVPIVMRAPAGGGVGAGPYHSQSPEAVFAHCPGIKVVCPGTVQDAYDMMRLAVADPNPVLYFEHKALYRSIRGPLRRRKPEGTLGRARVLREGRHVTVVSYAAVLNKALEVAEKLAGDGIDVEVIDLRSINPIDFDTIAASVSKTSRAIIAHEDTYTLGIGAEIAARLADRCLFDLDAPVMRVTAPDTPIPAAKPLEEAFVPSHARIEAAIREIVAL
ncbi:alpha-ketoacid dehydrogenase subunit beta [Mesorhizobium sp. 1B3]|uniref:alpha-ketoacid dehydrogenase subunit beta n=1 Tax=Mesorhizobium sp. 1B3 TaxID=3243599 RepID=UPI003D97BF7E